MVPSGDTDVCAASACGLHPRNMKGGPTYIVRVMCDNGKNISGDMLDSIKGVQAGDHEFAKTMMRLESVRNFGR